MHLHDSDLPSLVDAMVASYREDPRGHHINRKFLPSRTEIIEILQLIFQLFYPGYYGRQDLTDHNIKYHVGVLMSELRAKLCRQVTLCLCYNNETEGKEESESGPCACQGTGIAEEFLRQLPVLRRVLIEDIQAAYDGDPAAKHIDEIILAYPGFLALTVYRIAHTLHTLGTPLMPRIMTEWAHSQTGADLHPAAKIGASFFLDHATGVVIGETSEIGARVKLYQGVTLGAISHPRDAEGRVIRGTKRHPTVENDVTIYANTTVLGGETTVGQGSIVGGSVFLTQSVGRNSRVAMVPPELRVRVAREKESQENGKTESKPLPQDI